MRQDMRARALAKVMDDFAKKQDQSLLYSDADVVNRVFRIESDDDLIARYQQYLGGCSRCDRETLYDFTTR